MKRSLYLLLALLALPFLSGCDYLDALSGEPPEAKQWISKKGGVGIQLFRRGDRISGNMYWLNKTGVRFDAFLCEGVYDRENDSLVFPIHWRRGVGLKQVRTEGKDYIEFDELNWDAKTLVGKWRKNTDRPKYKRKFRPYDGIVPKRVFR